MQQATTQGPDNDQGELELCIFYQVDRCKYKRNECPFLHLVDPKYRLQEPCLDFRHNNCQRSDCFHSHDFKPLSQQDEEIDALLQSFFSKVRRKRSPGQYLPRSELAELFDQALSLIKVNNRCMEIAITRLATPAGLNRINEVLRAIRDHASYSSRAGPDYSILLRLFEILHAQQVIDSASVRPQLGVILRYIYAGGSRRTSVIFRAVLVDQGSRVMDGHQEELYTTMMVLLLMGDITPAGRLDQHYEDVVDTCETHLDLVSSQGDPAYDSAQEVLRLLQQRLALG